MNPLSFDDYFRQSALATYQRSRCEAGTSPLQLIRLDSPAHEVIDPPTSDLVIALILKSQGAARWSWDGASPNCTPERLPGRIGVTPPGTTGRFEIGGSSSVLLICVPRATVAARLGAGAPIRQDLGELHDAYCERPWLRSLCLRLWKAANTCAFGRDLRVDAICETLLLALSDDASGRPYDDADKGLGSGERRRVAHLLRQGDADVGQLASALGMSLRTLRRRFHASYGMSPHQWLILQKVEKAKQLLRASRKPLCDIAVELGFAHQAHFTDAFVRAVGCTPGRYRDHRKHVGDPTVGGPPRATATRGSHPR